MSGASGTSWPVRIRAKDGQNSVVANLEIINDADNPALRLSEVQKASHPKASMEVASAVEKKREIVMSFSSGYIGLRSQVSLIRSAYLAMFCQFGYGYLRYGTAEIVRRKILAIDEDIIARSAIVRLGGVPPSDRVIDIFVINEPFELRCFLIILRLKGSRNQPIGVIMPGLDSESASTYDRMETRRDELNGIEFRPLVLQPATARQLKDPRETSDAAELWAYNCQVSLPGQRPRESSVKLGIIRPRLAFKRNDEATEGVAAGYVDEF